MSGKLIVLEGLDGSGKSTQLELLKERFVSSGAAVRHIKLPDYGDRSSELVKMYLAGEFGRDAGEVNAYASSLFYAVDRFASFERHWSDDYESGKLILADRYTTSNAIYQMSKLPEEDWSGYLDWLEDTEYVKLGLPRPDVTIYLDVEPSISQELMTKRYSGDEAKKDIHERNVPYLLRCRRAALYAADALGWRIISCCDSDRLRPAEDIQYDILDILKGTVF